MVIAPFWFSMEHHWIALMPFWLSAGDMLMKGLIYWMTEIICVLFCVRVNETLAALWKQIFERCDKHDSDLWTLDCNFLDKHQTIYEERERGCGYHKAVTNCHNKLHMILLQTQSRLVRQSCLQAKPSRRQYFFRRVVKAFICLGNLDRGKKKK